MLLSCSSGSEPLSVSKSDILRGIITEKMNTAAREILAVVERTVTDYEAEASGFRQEIDRQRRQLELLLPQVRLHRGGVDKTDRLDFIWYNDDDDDDHDDDDDADDDDDGEVQEEQPVQSTSSLREKKENLSDPDYEIPPRSFSSRGQSIRKGPGRPRVKEIQNHLDLRVRLLEDCETEVLSNIVFRKSPIQDLRCPRGLQEEDFLALLRSSFPQLAAGEAFDLFLTDHSRRLQPVTVSSLTPEEIFSSISSTKFSTIYVRLKSSGDPQTSREDLHPPEAPDEEVPCSSAASTASMRSPRERQADKRRRGRPRHGEEPTHHFLRVCMLEDLQSDQLSRSVLQRSPVLDLKCPRGLQEGDFVDLLRSTFPQLVGDDKEFKIYKSDRSKKLQRLRVKTLTPEEIYKSMKSTGIRKTLLYIKLKREDDEESEEELRPPSPDGAMDEEEAALHSSSDGKRRRVASMQQHQDLDPDQEAAQSEADDEWRPELTEATASRSSKSRTPCSVCGVGFLALRTLIKHAWKHLDEPQSVCAVCAQSFPSSEELKEHLQSHQKTQECSYCGKSFFSETGLNNHVSLHTGKRRFKCSDCNKSFSYRSALNNHRWVHMEDKPHKCDLCSKAFGLRAQLTAHRKSHTRTGRHICNICGRSLYDLRSLTRHRTTHSSERRYGCDVCGKRFKLQGTLMSHQKTHTVRERSYLCHVCCKTFITHSSLMNHVKTHTGERPFVCTVCNKGFYTNADLKNHSRVHTGEAPFGCTKCGRFFKLKKTLKSHSLTHTGIKRFVCSFCGKACSRQEHLNVHMRTHNGERPYQCTLCEKAFTQSHCLKTHMKSHQPRDETREPSASEPALSSV